MDIKFDKNTIPCMRRAVCQIQNQEQTMEVRLSEAMPDIGRVLGCWGQVLVRGKEWRNGGMSVNGGVLAWALYAPEDGSQVRSVEAWIPFQMKWDFSDTERDGAICVTPYLKAMDARSTSARKLMVRANISVFGEALEPIESEICCPGTIPEDVQMLKKSYPAQIPQEAGEKILQIEEELIFPADLPPMDKILHYSMTPEVLEQKVMAGRLVFRGNARVQMAYSTANGDIHTWQHSVPFSQFTELDKDQGVHADSKISVILTGLELEKQEENKLLLKASMAAQYTIFDRVMLDIVQDAYSPKREVHAKMQDLNVSVLLDTCKQTVHIDHSLQLEGQQVISVDWLGEHPQCHPDGDNVQMCLPGQFLVLYTDNNGNLQSILAKAEGKWNFSSDAQNFVQPYVQDCKDIRALFVGNSLELGVDVSVEAAVFSDKGMPMVESLELGEIQQPDAHRPSLILRRVDTESLWEIAKASGSTVNAIQAANQLQDAPESGQMLLIPIA